MGVSYWHPLSAWASNSDNFSSINNIPPISNSHHQFKTPEKLSLGSRLFLSCSRILEKKRVAPEPIMMSTNSLSKSGTFLLKKYPSMELLETSAQPTTNIPKKTFSFEFPTSPEPSYREEIVHFSHQQHPLAKMTLPDLFTCTGCKEYGAGKRFACQQCDFQLHEFCALSTPSLNTHPLHGQHQLLFHSKSKSGNSKVLLTASSSYSLHICFAYEKFL